jgi:hypothetical protein
VLVTISGLSYVTNSFALYLSPALSRLLTPFLLASAGIPEMVLCVWLIVKGLNVQKWQKKEEASAGAVSLA